MNGRPLSKQIIFWCSQIYKMVLNKTKENQTRFVAWIKNEKRSKRLQEKEYLKLYADKMVSQQKRNLKLVKTGIFSSPTNHNTVKFRAKDYSSWEKQTKISFAAMKIAKKGTSLVKFGGGCHSYKIVKTGWYWKSQGSGCLHFLCFISNAYKQRLVKTFLRLSNLTSWIWKAKQRLQLN